MPEAGDQWSQWLRDRFDSHRRIRIPAELVRASGTKPNGRPVIDASTVTQWLRGRRPSFELAVVAARAFGVPREDALRAAGYEIDVDGASAEATQQAVPVGAGVDPEVLAEMAELEPEQVQRVRDFIRGIKAQ